MKNYNFLENISESIPSMQAYYYALFIKACTGGNVAELDNLAKNSNFDILYMLELSNHTILFDAIKNNTFHLPIWSRIQKLVENQYSHKFSTSVFHNILRYDDNLIGYALTNYKNEIEVTDFIINLVEKYLSQDTITHIMRLYDRRQLISNIINIDSEKIVKFTLDNIVLQHRDYIKLYQKAAFEGNSNLMNYLADSQPEKSSKIFMMSYLNGIAFWEIGSKSEVVTINTMNFTIQKTLSIEPNNIYKFIVSQDCEAFRQLIERNYNKAILFLMENIKQFSPSRLSLILTYNQCTFFRKSLCLHKSDIMLTFLYSAVHFITDKTEATEIINSMGDSIKDIEIKYIHNPHVVEIHNIFTNPARHNEKSNIIKLAEHGFPIYEQEFRKNLFNLRVICKNADEDFIAKTPGKECFINILEYLLPCTKKISTAGLETLLPGSQKITNLFHADSANVKRPRDESECWIERTSKRRQLTDHETRHQ